MDSTFIQSFDVATGESVTVSVTHTELEWKPIKVSQNDLDFMEEQRRIAQRIATIFGIPPFLMGFDGKTVDGSIVEPITDEKRLLG